MTSGEKHEKSLLGGVERFIGLRGQQNPAFFKKTTEILMALYEEELITEELLTKLKWGTKASKKYIDIDTSKKVRKAAEPFLKWLEEADEDESESE